MTESKMQKKLTLFDVTNLVVGAIISADIYVFIAISYLATSASIFTFHRQGLTPNPKSKRHLIIPALGIIFSIYLITQCSPEQIIIGILLLLVGVPVYVFASPKKELTEIKNALLSRQATLKRTYNQERVFLAHLMMHIKSAYRKARRKRIESEI